MLRCVIITTDSGNLLFRKEWVRLIEENWTRFGSLLRTIHYSFRENCKLNISYVEFASVALSLVQDDASGCICSLFHDIEDGEEFGRLIAQSVLNAFVKDYHEEFKASKTVNIASFQAFQNKLTEVIFNAAQDILNKMKQSKGIASALVVHDNGTHFSTGRLDDELGVTANLQALLSFSSDIMLAKQDSPQMVTLDLTQYHVIVHRVGPASLVSVCRKGIERSTYVDVINDAVSLFRRLYTLASNLKGS